MIVPFIVDFGPTVSGLTFAVCSFVSALIFVTLPETKNRKNFLRVEELIEEL